MREWLAEYPEEQVRRAATYTVNQLAAGVKIENVGGYLARMVSMGVILDMKESHKKEAAKAKAQHKQDEDKKTLLEKQKTDLMRAISDAENQVIADILEGDGVFQEIFQRVKMGRWGSFFEATKTDAENYQQIMTVRAAVNNEVKARFSKRFQKMKEHEELERVTRALAAM
jgi:hypothetical protein